MGPDVSAMNMLGATPWSACIVGLPTTRGRQYEGPGGFFGLGLLPTDSLGTMQLTIQNVVAGSRYRLEDTTNSSSLVDAIALGGDVLLTLPYYSPSRVLRLKVRNSSGSPAYQAFETLVTITAANASVYVLQALDE